MRSVLDGIFLDFYGTLVGGDREAVEAICADILAAHRMGGTTGELAVAWGQRFFAQVDQANDHAFCTLYECEQRSLRQTLADYGVTADPTPYVDRLRQYWQKPVLFADVLDALASWPLPVCLVSNVDRSDLEIAMANLGLRFDYVVTSEDARSYKPHPGIFEYALEQTGWPRDRVVHVGDSLHSDINGAQRCGLRTVWVDRPGRISDIGTCDAHHRVETLSQLACVVDGHG